MAKGLGQLFPQNNNKPFHQSILIIRQIRIQSMVQATFNKFVSQLI